MLQVQQWLADNNGNFSLLEEQLGIRSSFHDDGRVILNYSECEGPKTHPIVIECRALTLHREDYSLIARSFPRFFNLGEGNQPFNWDNFYSQEKVDGSLVKIFNWADNWFIQTRGSFSEGRVCNDHMITWYELIDGTLPKGWRDNFNPKYTYVGEICSLYNKVVKEFPTPTFYLLSIFNGYDELLIEESYNEADRLNLNTPKLYQLNDQAAATNFVNSLTNPTDEGLVLRDFDNNRIKVKSDDYRALHSMSNNGNPAALKNVIPLILNNNLNTLVERFPEVKDKVYEVKDKIDLLYKEVDNLWFCYHDEKSQKKFAVAVKDHPLSGALFAARKNGGKPEDYITSEYLLKVLQ